ncbi:efflux RND transporter permease subunit [Carboxylicivirga sediminis]|uniref:Efflux RND transporter permease subunit n=1 Tax=Carboxylicivirga sediminis TaxID=2006564 RepID=A0A941F3M8_9BACT|nr:efflux RND transporter permease subunit [Carboxylicivirga sediminis]MBR8536181.1 efflux RND transporter permease subunit [Carboxylicivirga sediminis]
MRELINRKVLVSMLFIALTMLGVISYRQLSFELIPNTEYPMLFVQVGATTELDPKHMEQEGVIPIEGIIGTLEGIEKIETRVGPQRAMIFVYLTRNADVKYSYLKLVEKIEGAANVLPENMMAQVFKADVEQMNSQFMTVQVRGEGGVDRVRNVVEQDILPKLESIDGISSIQVSGGRQKSVEIIFQQDVLDSYGLTTGRIRQLITSGQNEKVFAGKVVKGQMKYYVTAEADYNHISDIENIVVKSEGPVLLKDVAQINFSVKEEDSYSRVNGLESVSLAIAKDAQVNMIELSDNTLKQIEQINKEYQEKGIELVVVTNQAETMESNLDSIIELAFVGGILAIFILWIFLNNIPLVGMVMLSVPLSVYGAFNFFFAADISINMLTLVGLALAIGMLLDNSVVVMENIYRVASGGGGDSTSSVVTGTKEVWRSVTAATLTTVSVFLPFVFSEQMLFREIAKHISVSIISTLMVSLLVALILIPMLTHLFLSGIIKYRIEALEKLDLHNKLVQYYILLLKATLRKPAATIMGVLLVFFVVLIVSIGLSITTRQEAETTEFNINVEMPSGSMLSNTDQVVREIESRLESLEEKKDVVCQVYEDEAAVSVILQDDYKRIARRSIPEIKADIQNRISEIEGGEISLSQSATAAMGGGGGFGSNPGLDMMGFLGLGEQEEKVVIKGEDYDQMLLVANDVKYWLENEIDNLQRARVSSANKRPEIHLGMDAYLMGLLNIAPSNVVSELFTFRSEVSSGGQLKVNNEVYDIIMKTVDNDLPDETPPKTMDDLQKLNVTNNAGAIVPLRDFSEINYASGRTEILRVNQEKQIEVTYQFSDEVNASKTLLEDARAQVDELVASIPVSSKVSLKVIHEEDTFAEFKFLGLIGLLLVFMILASVFESLTAPVVMLFSVPLAAIGSLLALVLTGNSLLNTHTFIGFLILLGVVVNNGILLIDYSRQLRRQGYNHARALMQAGISRIRPIAITAITTIIAMMPLAMGKSEYVGILGAPFAITVVGGLSFSTLLTLVFMPTFAFGLDSALNWLRSLNWWLKGLIYATWTAALALVYFFSDASFAWQLLYGVLIITGVPSIVYFVKSSLRMANANLVAEHADVNITIRNLVKVYDRDTRFVREFKARNSKLSEQLLLKKMTASLLWKQLIWQLPVVGFMVYFTWWYLDSALWGTLFTVINYFVFISIYNSIALYWRNKTDVLLTHKWDKRVLKLLKYIYPIVGVALLVYRWDAMALAIILGALWYLLLMLIASGNKLKADRINIERVTGRFAGWRRTYYRMIRSIPLIGKEKVPFKALKGISLEFKTGMIGLLGPNGAGKTTLMRIICGVLEQSYGKVYINGFDTAEHREELQGIIGYLPQEFGTYENMTAYEFLDYQAIVRGITEENVRIERLQYVLQSVHMWERKDDKIGAFSGGMKQRIGIAMILLHLPKILVVDEPTAGLDPRERIRFRNLLVELSRERIVLFSTHIIEDISSSCNQVAVMSKGELRYWGEPGEMVKIAHNRVWQFDIKAEAFDEINQQFLIVHHMRDGANIRVRCIANEQPVEDAISVGAVLEDAYIWLLKNKSENNE